ncbi:LysR family transcriptional regulator [Paenisporosarcina sp. OV554]|uniref:LysR family transcriptional regulator n=1 Tax=Paenisporosarcina sp. OV554 TaxID=2135694 RepID=UPI000D4D5AB2|nr:LysR family transcriptional regulator [Paenisporosarcina sp. OV554]PUB10452.1 DNA-binding transcriptional LysR family regulator [Paenisporosarcina sp. OV554]
MNIERLNYIYEVSKTESISIAAQNLHVTQPTISQAITCIEKELGVSIFIRSKQGTLLTLEGKNLIITIKEVIEKVQELKDKGLYYQDGIYGVIRIGTITGLMGVILRVFSNFKKKYPNVQIDIVEKTSIELVDDILNQKIDIGVINFHNYLPEQINEFPKEFIFNNEMRICVSKKSHLALKETIIPEDLRNETAATYSSGIDPFTKKLLEIVPINIIFMSDNTNAIYAAVNENIAFAISTLASQDEPTILNGQIVSIPFVSNIVSTLPFGIVRSKNKQVKNLNDHFISDLKKELLEMYSRALKL